MKSLNRESLRITVNSAAYYILSYLVIAFIFQFTSSAIAFYAFQIPSVFHQNAADYLLKPEAWSFDSVKVVYSAGAVISLIIGLLCLIVYLKALVLDGLLRLFFLWGFIHGINMFLGSVMLGAFIFEGFGYVLSWMYLQDTAKMILLFICLFLILASGSLMTRPFLYSANTYYNMLTPEMRPAFRRYQFYLPYFIGTILLFMIRMPLSLYEFLLLISPGLFILPLMWGINKYPPYFFEERPKKIEVHWRPVIITIVVIILYRMILGIGITID
ncbi:MAG TPA: hypothetical protein PLJ84_06775 [Bacteroidales bacterium]|nr:hypothetical protein [Bacteroidales bacterium]